MRVADAAVVAQNLREQDNRGTGNPIFLVQQKVRDYGYSGDFADDWVFLSPEGHETDAAEYGYADRDELTETGAKDRWEFVQPFFTDEAAKRYIRENQHNLGECRVWVGSGYRNDEWALARQVLGQSNGEVDS